MLADDLCYWFAKGQISFKSEVICAESVILKQIKGLHHISSMARDAGENNRFFTQVLGLRRVKKTVNFDAPDVYHLYYGDELGSPGSVMTYFPFPNIGEARSGAGEVATIALSVPENSLPYWTERLSRLGVQNLQERDLFGEKRIGFTAPEGDHFELVETLNERRNHPWTGSGVGAEQAIRGFHSASLRLRDSVATEELLRFMGYEMVDEQDGIQRMAIQGNGANIIDLETVPGAATARLGAGSVHHIAFAVEDRAAQLDVRQALISTGHQVTPVIDRDYFDAIYFRTPGGVLFEIATNEPGFDRDEEKDHLGEALKLPSQHEHLRPFLEKHLAPLEG